MILIRHLGKDVILAELKLGTWLLLRKKRSCTIMTVKYVFVDWWQNELEDFFETSL